ncbi:glycosyltransferase family A protein [Agromyces mediolanus]|uniref:glycosyltransferase family 2 protein n=1 Tax=Agromyces mediolanus TaxID=41986 RepID=UPI0038356016
MPAAEVDLVIAAHDPRRQLGRAVSSALSSARVARVIVVCHNTPASGIAERLGALADDRRVHLEHLDDGIPSPAGPFNRGLEGVRADYFAIMGSDDELAPGAVDRWIEIGERTGAEVVLPVLRYAGGRRVPTPPTRPGRAARLDPVRDRLAYRTAPLGIMSTGRFGSLRFTAGLATGEDLRFSTELWFSGAKIARVRRGAEYLIHDDAERVTFAKRTVADDLAAVALLLRDRWALGLGERQRQSLAVKLWRLPVFGAVHTRAGAWSVADRRALRDICAMLDAFAPRARGVLSRADEALVRAILDLAATDAELDARSRARRRFVSPRALLPNRLSAIAAREAPLRFAAATWLAGRD